MAVVERKNRAWNVPGGLGIKILLSSAGAQAVSLEGEL